MAWDDGDKGNPWRSDKDKGPADLDAVVDEALAAHALAHAGRVDEVDGALLEHARAHPMLDVFARAILEDDGADPFAMEKVRQHEPGRSRAHDADLRAKLLRHAA